MSLPWTKEGTEGTDSSRYPFEKEMAADGMSPPRVGSKMQDYDHWDALVIGEWPPGRSGPQVSHTNFSLFIDPLLLCRYSFSLSYHVMC